MSLREKYRKIVAGLAPAGAVGVSVLLGSVAPAGASVGGQEPAGVQPAVSVAERLAAVRDAVSEVAGQQAGDGEGLRLAWGNWGNGGFWRPYGWGNGAWRPWGNWRNGWNNWGNGWNNWGNYWRPW